MTTYPELVARGCLCGTEQSAECPIHGVGDNRGIAAWFKAGMPQGFPLAATCALCGASGLMYPNVELDDPARSGGYRPTLVCPRCSTPATERALVRDAESFGYELNPARVFGAAAVAA
jgi:hypothetical protein